METVKTDKEVVFQDHTWGKLFYSFAIKRNVFIVLKSYSTL